MFSKKNKKKKSEWKKGETKFEQYLAKKIVYEKKMDDENAYNVTLCKKCQKEKRRHGSAYCEKCKL